jgi:hypothetical protein
MAHALGPAAAFAWRGFSDHDWQAIEAALGAEINGAARTEITAAAECYLVGRWVEDDESQRNRLRGRVDKNGKTKDATGPRRLLNAIDRLTQVWAEVYAADAERDVLNAYDASLVGTGHLDLREAIDALQYHRIKLRQWLKNGRRGDPFVRLVGQLGATFEHCTGRRPTVGSPPADLHDAPLTPFVAVVKAVDRAMPEAVRRDRGRDNSAAAWSKAVSRALKGQLTG